MELNAAYSKLIQLLSKHTYQNEHSIECAYNEPHRFFHGINHLHSVISYPGIANDDALLLAAGMHDFKYDPMSQTNEYDSSQLIIGNDTVAVEARNLIIQTKDHTGTSAKAVILNAADLSVLESDFSSLVEYEKQIYKEFQCYPHLDYIVGRVSILRNLQSKYGFHLDELVNYIISRDYKIGVFAGSFNPFHIGHKNILEKAEQIFDKVIIAHGKNIEKPDSVAENIPKYHQYINYTGLMTDMLKSFGHPVTLIRGIRDMSDMEYEKKQLSFIRDFDPNVQAIYIVCDKQYEHISSSAIRGLNKLRNEVDDPDAFKEHMRKYLR